MAGRYYWLKLQDGFFGSKRIKKLRRMAGGDTYVVIYLKMQLAAMKSGGVLTFSGLEADFAEELALDLDEEADNVRITLAYLLSCGLVETSDNISFFFPWAVANTGSETAAAERMRRMRERNGVTPALRNGYVEKEKIKKEDLERKLTKESSSAKPDFSTDYQQSFQQEGDFEKKREEALRLLHGG